MILIGATTRSNDTIILIESNPSPVKFHVVTLFPEMFDGPVTSSIIGRAASNGIIEIEFVNPRDFTTDKHRSVDAPPYGGGPGMVMMAPPLAKAVDSINDRYPVDHQPNTTGNGRHRLCDPVSSPEPLVATNPPFTSRSQPRVVGCSRVRFTHVLLNFVVAAHPRCFSTAIGTRSSDIENASRRSGRSRADPTSCKDGARSLKIATEVHPTFKRAKTDGSSSIATILSRDLAPPTIRILDFGTFNALEITLMVASFAALFIGDARTRTDNTCDSAFHPTTSSIDERGVTRTEIRCSLPILFNPRSYLPSGQCAQIAIQISDQ